MGYWNVPCYYEKINYSNERIVRYCFLCGLIPLIYTAGYLNSALKYSNYITWFVSILVTFSMFYIVIRMVYVKPKSWLYIPSCYVWVSFILLTLALNFPVVYKSAIGFLFRNNGENMGLDIISLGKNDALGMIYLITPIFASVIIDKYLMGVSGKMLKEHVCKLGTRTGRFLYPIQIFVCIFILYISIPMIYFNIYTPLIGKVTPSILHYEGFRDLLSKLSISGIIVTIVFLFVLVVEWLKCKGRL